MDANFGIAKGCKWMDFEIYCQYLKFILYATYAIDFQY